MVKNPPTNVGDLGLIPELGRSPGEGNGMDGGAWQVRKSQTQLNN